jgi:hypothetical protein
VAARGLSLAELTVDDVAAATTALQRLPEVDECAHYGHVLRLATRGGTDAVALATERLATAGVGITSIRATRATVEDAFVSMVREDQA